VVQRTLERCGHVSRTASFVSRQSLWWFGLVFPARAVDRARHHEHSFARAWPPRCLRAYNEECCVSMPYIPTG
jgi:hypothetical protein